MSGDADDKVSLGSVGKYGLLRSGKVKVWEEIVKMDSGKWKKTWKKIEKIGSRKWGKLKMYWKLKEYVKWCKKRIL